MLSQRMTQSFVQVLDSTLACYCKMHVRLTADGLFDCCDIAVRA